MRQSLDPLKLLQQIAAEPHRQDFYGVLRAIECAYPNQPRLGHSVRALEDPIRLGQDPSLVFAPATISALQPGLAGAPPRLVQLFFGLMGPHGPLPLHLTEFIRERLLHHRDPAVVRFLDILVHRPLTLFFRAWSQAQPTASFDRPKSDRFSAYVGALIGMGTPALRRRDAAGDHVRLFFAGWLARQPRSADGLRAILEGFFQLPVRIAEFAGHWMRLPGDDLTRLGINTPGSLLGIGAVLGTRVWDRQHRIQVAFGPLTLAQYESLLPGGQAQGRLSALMRHYLGFEIDWDLRLSLKREQIPTARLGGPTRLGWSAWLGSRLHTADADDLAMDVERVVRLADPDPNTSTNTPPH